MSITELEQLAIAFHAAGRSWAEFWRSHAADVDSLFKPASTPWGPASKARRRFVDRLARLVAAGNVDGSRPPEAGYARPLDCELEAIEGAQ